MITYYYKSLRGKELSKIEEFKKGAWVYVEKPSSEELDELAEKFKLDRDLLTDAVDPNEIPRAEIDAGITYVYTRVPVEKDGETLTESFFVAVGDTFLLTIGLTKPAFLDPIFKGKTNISTTQKTKLFLQIFFGINRTYNRSLTSIGRKIRFTRSHVRKVTNTDIAQFVMFETTLNDFVASLVPNEVLLKNILSKKYLELFEEDEDLVEDLSLANSQLVEMARSNLKTIGNIRSAYSTLMTNELNRTIRILTALTIILAVPTMIASFYGMNVPLPLADSSAAFLIIVGIALFFAGTLFYIFTKNRWL